MGKPAANLAPTDVENVTQLRTSARERGVSAPAGVPSSVFHAGSLAKPPRAKHSPRSLPPLRDASSITIKTGVPLPPMHASQPGESPYAKILAKLKPGCCAELPAPYARTLLGFARKQGVKVAARKLSGDLVGVWRLE